jgi:hypothetical protein
LPEPRGAALNLERSPAKDFKCNREIRKDRKQQPKDLSSRPEDPSGGGRILHFPLKGNNFFNLNFMDFLQNVKFKLAPSSILC